MGGGWRPSHGFSKGPRRFILASKVLERAGAHHSNAGVSRGFPHLDGSCRHAGNRTRSPWPSDLPRGAGQLLGTSASAAVIDEYRGGCIEAALKHGKDVAMLVQSLREAENAWIQAGVKSSSYAFRGGYPEKWFAAVRQRPCIARTSRDSRVEVGVFIFFVNDFQWGIV